MAQNININQRCLLEIFSKELDEEERKKSLPDAVVIMMNPGSAKPVNNLKQKTYTIRNIKCLAKCIESQQHLVLTKPDRTQYQLMRVMNRENWTHVRVVNLSDIRDPKSQVFYQKLKALKKNRKVANLHSIFAEERIGEQEYIFKIKENGYVICAWGLSKELEELGKLCKSRIPVKLRVVGLHKEKESKHLYYHPLQRGGRAALNKWVEDICECLKL